LFRDEEISVPGRLIEFDSGDDWQKNIGVSTIKIELLVEWIRI
jgi:hypothetical protein